MIMITSHCIVRKSCSLSYSGDDVSESHAIEWNICITYSAPPIRHLGVEMEEQDYLMPNFDPNKLRVPELRRILLFHDVEYRSSAKKPELVSLFQANITPKAKIKRRKIRPIQPSIEFVLPNGEIKPQIFMPSVSQLDCSSWRARKKRQLDLAVQSGLPRPLLLRQWRSLRNPGCIWLS